MKPSLPSRNSGAARQTRLHHPDEVTGALSRILGRFAQPSANTLADLDAYRGLPADVLFPEPEEIPAARVTTRWRLPGLVSEDVVFPSLHEPIEPRFRRRYSNEYRETHTVYTRRIRPLGAGRRPRLLYLHGYMQPETYLEEFSAHPAVSAALVRQCATVDHLLTTTRSVRRRLDVTRPVEAAIIERCIEIAFQAPALIEEAVLRATRGCSEERAFRRERDGLYLIADEDAREQAFRDFHASWATCPLCRFATYDPEPQAERLADDIVERITGDFPAWNPADGLCRQCADLYPARALSLAAAARLPG